MRRTDTAQQRSSGIRSDFGRQGFGAMRLREARGGTDRDPVAVVHAALDAGIAMLDTADAYGNEDLVGRTIRGRRDEVLLASKFGLVWREEVAGGFDLLADPSYVRQACEASLRRLAVDEIDLYYLHHRSDTTPIEETVGAMADLVEQGKVRALGLSNVTAEDVRRAHAVHRIAALQEQWSVSARGIEDELLPVAAEIGAVVVAHSPTSHGLLHQARSTVDEGETGRLRAALTKIGDTHHSTAGQVALAWVHHRQQVHDVPVVPIPGTSSVTHLLDNVAAADLSLSDAELSWLDSIGSALQR